MTTVIVTQSGGHRVLPERLEPKRVVGLDQDGRIVVDDFDAFNREPELREYADGQKIRHTPFLFGLTLCCDASDKGIDVGVVCRGCYGFPGEMVDGKEADTGSYLYKHDGGFPGLDPLDHFEDGHGNTINPEQEED